MRVLSVPFFSQLTTTGQLPIFVSLPTRQRQLIRPPVFGLKATDRGS
jgi:hypothetical protein